MDIQVGNEAIEEIVVTRVTVINPSEGPVKLPQRYRGLFRGAEELGYGRHVFRFPITHIGYKRLVSQLQVEFLGKLKVDFGTSGTDEF